MSYETAIRRVIPKAFFNQAAQILEAHRPKNPALKRFEPLAMALTPQHHGELNSYKFYADQPAEQTSRRIAELRREYADDPFALEQIGIFDPTSQYRQKIKEIRKAMNEGDSTALARIQSWFMKNYPLTTKLDPDQL